MAFRSMQQEYAAEKYCVTKGYVRLGLDRAAPDRQSSSEIISDAA